MRQLHLMRQEKEQILQGFEVMPGRITKEAGLQRTKVTYKVGGCTMVEMDCRVV